MMFVSEYRLPNGDKQHTQVYADDEQHLVQVLARRKMGEQKAISPPALSEPTMPSKLLEQSRHPEAMHALIWVSMIATSAGVATNWELMNDNGLIHELAHYNQVASQYGYALGGKSLLGFFDLNNWRRALIQKLRTFEERVPGVMESVAERRRLAGTLTSAKLWGARADLMFIDDPSMYEMKSGKLTAAELRAALLDDYIPREEAHYIRAPEAVRDQAKRTKKQERAFALDSVAQGRAAKAERIAKLLAKMPEPQGMGRKMADTIIEPEVQNMTKEMIAAYTSLANQKPYEGILIRDPKSDARFLPKAFDPATVLKLKDPAALEIRIGAPVKPTTVTARIARTEPNVQYVPGTASYDLDQIAEGGGVTPRALEAVERISKRLDSILKDAITGASFPEIERKTPIKAIVLP